MLSSADHSWHGQHGKWYKVRGQVGLLEPRTLRDGSRVTTFVRYGDFMRMAFRDLGWLLRAAFPGTVDWTGGPAAVFVHRRRHSGCDFRSPPPGGSWTGDRLRGPAFSAEEPQATEFRFRGGPLEVESCHGSRNTVWVPLPPLEFPDAPAGEGA